MNISVAYPDNPKATIDHSDLCPQRRGILPQQTRNLLCIPWCSQTDQVVWTSGFGLIGLDRLVVVCGWQLLLLFVRMTRFVQSTVADIGWTISIGLQGFTPDMLCLLTPSLPSKMFFAARKNFGKTSWINSTQPTTNRPAAQRMAPPCRPFHELPLFRDSRSTSDPADVAKVVPFALELKDVLACEWLHRDPSATLADSNDQQSLTTEMTETDAVKLASVPKAMAEMDVGYVHALFDRMSVEMDEVENDPRFALLQTPRVYEFNDAGEFILPTKSTTNFLVPSEAGCSSFSMVSGTPSLVTVPSSSPLLPSSPIGPDTPSPSTYPIIPLSSSAPFKPSSSASLLRIIDYSGDDVSISSDSPIDARLGYESSNSFSTSRLTASPAPASGCEVIQEVSTSQRHFHASSSQTFGSPGDFEERNSLIHFSSPAVGFETAEPTSSRFNPGSSQTFGEPGYQGSFGDVVLDDSPQPPSTSAFGCAMDTAASHKSISFSSCSPAPDAEHRTIGVEHFHIKKMLGSGAFGDVYLTKHRVRGTLHAMKVIPKNKTSHPQAKVFLLNESRILRRLADAESPFVVNLEASFSDSRNYYFVMNFFPGGDLEDLIHSRNEPFAMVTLKSYTTDLVQGLMFLRKNRVIHRDIKPANVFIDARGHLVLGDYGLARMFETGNPMFEHPELATLNEDDWGALTYCEVTDMTDSTCGSLGYMAPEIILRDPYSALVDIWSLGATFYEMTFGMMPFPGDSREELMAATVYMELEFPGQNGRWPIDEKLKDLIQKMLVKQQRDRIRLQAIVNHPYFDDVDWDLVASGARQSDALLDDGDDGEVHIITGNAIASNPESSFEYISPRWQGEEFVRPTSTPGGGQHPHKRDEKATAPTRSYGNGGPDSEGKFNELRVTQLHPSRPSNPLYRTSIATLSLGPPSLTRNAADTNGKIHQHEDSGCSDLGQVVKSSTDLHSKSAPALHHLTRSTPELEKMLEKLPPVPKSCSVVIGGKNGARTVHSVRSGGLEQQVHPPRSSIEPRISQPLVGNVFLDELRCYVPGEGTSDEDSSVTEPAAPIPLVGSRLSMSLEGCCSSASACLLHEECNAAIPDVVVLGPKRSSSPLLVTDDETSAESSTDNSHRAGALASISDPILAPSTLLEEMDLSYSIAENRTLVDTIDLGDIHSGLMDARHLGMSTDTDPEVSRWAESSYTRCGSASSAPSTNHATELEDNPQKLVVDASSTSNSVSSTGQRKSRRTLAKVLKTGIRATKNVFKGVARIRLRRS